MKKLLNSVVCEHHCDHSLPACQLFSRCCPWQGLFTFASLVAKALVNEFLLCLIIMFYIYFSIYRSWRWFPVPFLLWYQIIIPIGKLILSKLQNQMEFWKNAGSQDDIREGNGWCRISWYLIRSAWFVNQTLYWKRLRCIPGGLE